MKRILLTLALLCGALEGRALAQTVEGGQLTASVTGVRNNQGNVRCMLYDSSQASAFPQDFAQARQTVVAPIVNGRAECRFTGVAPGTYAVAAYHDENGNGVLDRHGNGRGRPREGVGASRNAKRFMGAPHFGQAQFAFGGGDQTISLQMRY